jgi:hypothetical protein
MPSYEDRISPSLPWVGKFHDVRAAPFTDEVVLEEELRHLAYVPRYALRPSTIYFAPIPDYTYYEVDF